VLIMATCRSCDKEIPEGAKRCPACLREATSPDDAVDDVYELPETAEIPPEWQHGAVYTLELPVRCPHCRELIRSLRVLRIKRTQVSFTSTLPRGGRVIACPQCERVLSAELATL
jgi:hypothetical protein